MKTNEKRTLAKELKIQNMERQKAFIFEQLRKYDSEIKPADGGDVFFVYKGFIFPEVKEALENEDFYVEPLKPATAIGYFGSPQVNIIRISDNVDLSPDEKEESKKYAHLPTQNSDSNGHKSHYFPNKPRYKSFAEYEASMTQQDDEYGKSQNDDSVDSDYMPKLVADIKLMRQASNQPNDVTTSIDAIYGGDQDLDTVFTSSPSSTTGGTAIPLSSNSILAIEPNRNQEDNTSTEQFEPKRTIQSFHSDDASPEQFKPQQSIQSSPSQGKRIQKAQKRQERGRKGKR